VIICSTCVIINQCMALTWLLAVRWSCGASVITSLFMSHSSSNDRREGCSDGAGVGPLAERTNGVKDS
jgi:hypothetical protein